MSQTIDTLLNRLHLGDNRELFARLPDDSVDLVLTDPPYKNYVSNRPTAHKKLKSIQHGQFDVEFFARESFRVLKTGCHLYCFCDHQTFPTIRTALEAAGFRYRNCLVWVKNNHGSGDLRGNWAPQHEFIIFASKGRTRPLNGKRQSNVLGRRPGKGLIEPFHKVSNYRFNHGTTKPVELLQVLIQASSLPDEIVLDPYGGSGSTAVACILERRRFILSEIDPEYYRIARVRISPESFIKP